MTLAALAIAAVLSFGASPGRVDSGALASAIAGAASSEHDVTLLAAIAWHESGFLSSVAECRRKGDGGRAHGLWQVHLHPGIDAADACTVEGGARAAMLVVRQARDVVGRRRMLRVYAHGDASRETRASRELCDGWNRLNARMGLPRVTCDE